MRRGLLAIAVAAALLGASTACDYTGAPGGVRMSVVGESIAGGAEAELRADFGQERQIHTLLINHRHIRQIGAYLPDIVDDPDLRILVVQLGVNDSAEKRTATQIQADMRAFLQVAAPAVECVWWLDIKEDVLVGNPVYDAMAPRFNQILRGEAARHANVHVGEFDAWATARPQYLGKDGLHLSGAGRVAFTNWVENELVASC
jgi:lysophospholipase L1-like esterase